MNQIEIYSPEKGAQIFNQRLDLLEQAISIEQRELADNTRYAYDYLWRKYETWCHSNHIEPIPSSFELLSFFAIEHAPTLSLQTIDLAICAVKKVHAKLGIEIGGDKKYFQRIMRGIIRTYGSKIPKKAKALSLMEYAAKAGQIENTSIGIRNKAILSVGFFGGLRRSEIANLNWNDIEFYDNSGEKGVKITLNQTKESLTPTTIYLAQTSFKHICPVQTLQNLRDIRVTELAIFTSVHKGGNITQKRILGQAISLILKQYFGEEYSGHSMRRGVITELANKHTPIHIIKKISRHKSIAILTGYMEAAESYVNTSSKILNA